VIFDELFARMFGWAGGGGGGDCESEGVSVSVSVSDKATSIRGKCFRGMGERGKTAELAYLLLTSTLSMLVFSCGKTFAH